MRSGHTSGAGRPTGWPGAWLLLVLLGLGASSQAGEILGRGLLCLPRGETTNYCTWRLLPDDPGDIGFNLYRATDASGPFTRVNAEPLTAGTNLTDGSGISVGTTYYYRVRTVDAAGAEGLYSELSRVTAGAARNYVQLDLQVPMSIARVVPGDLNADGELDFVVLTPHYVGPCPMTEQATFQVEALISGGGTWVRAWKTDTLVGQPANMCEDNRMVVLVWDLDGDARAEVVLRAGSLANELWILDGSTGELLASGPWPNWPDTLGVTDRHYAVIALLRDVDGDGAADPFIVIERGLYLGKQLFTSHRYDAALGQVIEVDRLFFDDDAQGRGTHGLPAMDIDNDGRDEILACQTVIDDDFTELWSVGRRHNDTCYAADIRPDIPGLEVFMGEEGLETWTYLVATRPDGTPQILWTKRARREVDCVSGLPAGYVCRFSWERGWSAELEIGRPGWESYQHEHWEHDRLDLKKGYGHIYSADGGYDGSAPTGRWPMDWVEGEGVKELYSFCNPPGVSGCSYYSGWPADVFGDSREESVVFLNKWVRIFTNTDTTSNRYVTPLADRGYRAAVARVGVGYNTNFIPAKTNQAREDLVPGCLGVTCAGACCAPGQVCFEGACCQPGCAARECGGDGCGGSCGECAEGEVCNAAGSCVPDACVPDCSGRECGPDPVCGEPCGECEPRMVCDLDGVCIHGCVPDCTGRECGDDGCEGSCGQCTGFDACNPQGLCMPVTCEPDCSGRECGDDGCEGSCGECAEGSVCSAAGICEDEEEPTEEIGGCGCGGRGVPAAWYLSLILLVGWLARGRFDRRRTRLR